MKTKLKTAIIILTDAKDATQEALTRMLNALAMADECRRAGDELAIAFVGSGTRWPAKLSELGHPANAIYDRLRPHIVGASRSCAVRNEAVEGLESAGIALVGDNEVEGMAGVFSIRRYLAEGWNVVTF
ncbi:hypothetical protein [Pelagicoccus sp. SDUM812003]|uniref:hypothetical protein n=1 Tax=Pelagicoccus sp. SDUM812003 TaxID=3041267 RepID=UPI00280F65B4|nr:hypothetical protein [Pelagicoccus sp. SDUM812003]MDQ8202946.1 hypothetical protein [Pelagicoccus sp. SDUM812003]